MKITSFPSGPVRPLAGLLLVLLPGLCPAQEPVDPKLLIDKFISACGGEQKLGQLKAASFTRKLTFAKTGKVSTQKVHLQLPDQFRSETEQEENGKKIKLITVMSGNKAWTATGEAVEEKTYTDEQAANAKRLFKYQLGLLPLQLKDPDLKFASLGDSKVGDKETVGVKVTNPKSTKYTPRNYYFDKKTGLLLKREMILKDKEGKEFHFQMLYYDYQNVNGIVVAYKTVSKRDGEVIVEQQINDYRILDKVDAKLFQKPVIVP